MRPVSTLHVAANETVAFEPGVIRGGEKLSAAAAKAPIEAGDQLVAVGRSEDLVILRGLKELVIEREVTADDHS
jgi:hypothetical protein